MLLAVTVSSLSIFYSSKLTNPPFTKYYWSLRQISLRLPTKLNLLPNSSLSIQSASQVHRAQSTVNLRVSVAFIDADRVSGTAFLYLQFLFFALVAAQSELGLNLRGARGRVLQPFYSSVWSFINSNCIHTVSSWSNSMILLLGDSRWRSLSRSRNSLLCLAVRVCSGVFFGMLS